MGRAVDVNYMPIVFVSSERLTMDRLARVVLAVEKHLRPVLNEVQPGAELSPDGRAVMQYGAGVEEEHEEHWRCAFRPRIELPRRRR